VKKILVAFDGSDNALRACSAAACVAKAYGAEVTVLHAMGGPSIYAAPLANEEKVRAAKAKELMDKAVSFIKKEGVSVQGETIEVRASTVQAIVEYAEQMKADLTVLGTRGMGGFRKLLIGSVSSGVATHARMPVMVVRNGGKGEGVEFKRIMIATDGSKDAAKAVTMGADMAGTLKSELTILNVIHIPTSAYASGAPSVIDRLEKDAREDAEKIVSEAASAAKEKGVKAKVDIIQSITSPVNGIAEYAGKSGIDLLVVGTRGLGGFRRVILGSVASGLLSYAGCSVLIVR
jgi:nucleotide-binding universal stress UspA family protein